MCMCWSPIHLPAYCRATRIPKQPQHPSKQQCWGSRIRQWGQHIHSTTLGSVSQKHPSFHRSRPGIQGRGPSQHSHVTGKRTDCFLSSLVASLVQHSHSNFSNFNCFKILLWLFLNIADYLFVIV